MSTATSHGPWTHEHPGLMSMMGAAVLALAVVAMLLLTGSAAAVWEAVAGDGGDAVRLTNGLELVNPSSREH